MSAESSIPLPSPPGGTIAKKRIQLDLSLEGAEQLLASLREHVSAWWDGGQWVPFTGEPKPPAIAVLRYTAPRKDAPDNSVANPFLIYWQSKGDGSVVTVPTDVPGTTEVARIAAYLVEVQKWLDSARKRPKGDRTPIPDSITQPTFIEARFTG